MNLYLDTATSSRWTFGRDISDNEQPYMVRLAWLLEAPDGSTIREACHLIRLPEGEKMDHEAAHHTGIYDHKLIERGLGLFNVLTEFAEALGEAVHISAHSWAFHRQVLERSFRLVGMPARVWQTATCAMIASTPLVRIPKQSPGGGYKWPSFDQCCVRFLGAEMTKSADPIADGLERARAVRTFNQHIRRDAAPR